MKFISISKYPGKMGETIFNAAFKKLKINASYKAIKKSSLINLRKYLIKNNIYGCGVSMPFKERIITYLDKQDNSVKKTRSCNTIILKNKKMKGYNTDYLGIKKIIQSSKISKKNEFYIFGAGGYARSFYKALEDLKYNKIYIINRSFKRFKLWPKGSKVYKLKKFPDYPNFNVIINATPIGMIQIKKKEYLSKINLKKTKFYFECVVSPKKTKNINIARHNSIKTIPGYKISIEQAKIQFKLYVKKKISSKFIKKTLNESLLD